MPKIDPITGTFFEFIHEEAVREGKQPEQITDEIFGPMAEEDRHIEEHYRTHALEIISKVAQQHRLAWVQDSEFENKEMVELVYDTDDSNEITTVPYVYDAGVKPPLPVKLVEIMEVRHHQSLHGSEGRIIAIVECDDHVNRKVTWDYFSDPVTCLDPYEGGEDLKWEDV